MMKTFARSRRFLLVAALATCAGAVTISACSDDDNNGPSGSVSVAVVPTELTITPGSSGTAEIGITRGGSFTGPVTVAASGQPATVEITFDPGPLDANTTASTATIVVGVGTTPGLYPVTISAAGNGITTKTTTLALTVGETPAARQ